MYDTIRDAPLGQIVRYFTGSKYLPYPEEKEGFVFNPNPVTVDQGYDSEATTQPGSPSALEKENENPLTITPTQQSDSGSVLTAAASIISGRAVSRTVTRTDLTRAISVADVEKVYNEAAQQARRPSQPNQPLTPARTNDGKIIVTWYTTDDQANPQNWSRSKKNFVVGQICLYTLAVYISSSIYTPSEEWVVETFGISPGSAALAMSMYVLGYGLGPLLFAPLTEIPIIGRNPPYILTFTAYVALAIGAAEANNYSLLVALRFFQGFVGSPALSTGGASISDMIHLFELPYYIVGWAAAATAGPTLGPIISGFSVPYTNWHWSLWEIVWLSGPILVLIFLCLPETSADTILLYRARRLRKITGNPLIVAQSEIDNKNIQISTMLANSIWRPIQINLLDPAIAFTSIYLAILYATLFSFFESFPVVFGAGYPSPSPTKGYGFNLGEQGAVFLSLALAIILAIIIYCSYLWFYFDPSVMKYGLGPPERRLVPGLVASLVAPCGLILFAWTGYNAPHHHWIVPIIGVILFTIPGFIMFQVIFIYIPMTYPQYAASLFGGNDAARSSFAAGAIHFSAPMFRNLGIARGVTLLAGLSCLGIVGIYFLYYRGAWLRSKSRFAAK